MKEIRLTEEEFNELAPYHMEHVIHNESNIYDMPNNPDKLLKIYSLHDKDYLDKLADNGFDEELINCFNSIYEEDIDNINPLVHLNTLYDLDEEKLTLARKIF